MTDLRTEVSSSQLADLTNPEFAFWSSLEAWGSAEGLLPFIRNLQAPNVLLQMQVCLNRSVLCSSYQYINQINQAVDEIVRRALKSESSEPVLCPQIFASWLGDGRLELSDVPLADPLSCIRRCSLSLSRPAHTVSSSPQTRH